MFTNSTSVKSHCGWNSSYKILTPGEETEKHLSGLPINLTPHRPVDKRMLIDLWDFSWRTEPPTRPQVVLLIQFTQFSLVLHKKLTRHIPAKSKVVRLNFFFSFKNTLYLLEQFWTSRDIAKIVQRVPIYLYHTQFPLLITSYFSRVYLW